MAHPVFNELFRTCCRLLRLSFLPFLPLVVMTTIPMSYDAKLCHFLVLQSYCNLGADSGLNPSECSEGFKYDVISSSLLSFPHNGTLFKRTRWRSYPDDPPSRHLGLDSGTQPPPPPSHPPTHRVSYGRSSFAPISNFPLLRLLPPLRFHRNRTVLHRIIHHQS
ncbi:hypothetical protein BJV78DRAFT_471384 [Lactifluus subvellereus]|nr:hypothetical protein BJV78DRAFT_471384 [Lactifluus subvellereus]